MRESALTSIVGPEHVLTDADLRASAEVDWTGRWRGTARAVVRPGSPGEVAAVLAACSEAGVPVVPQGGNTGLVGGGVPAGLDGAVVLSTRRLTGLAPVAADGTVVAGAGATIAAVQAHAAAAGWQFGMDWAARDSATVGGAVATNAGGLRVLRWGPARAQLVGAEVALAGGALLSRVEGPLKDSTGYDLSALLCGSEGTLGVLTRVRLRLVRPLPAPRAVALVGLPGVAAAVELLGGIRRAGADLAAAELIGAAALEVLDLPAPLPDPWPVYVLLEVIGHAEDLAEALAGTDAGDAVLADDAAGRARLWRYREEITEAISRAGVPIKLDVAVPLHRLAEVWAGLADGRTVLFGHLAEGNVHVNLLGVPAADEYAAVDRVLRLVAAAGGSISAEHGIGRAKAGWLHLTRSAAEVATMRAVKAALDPAGLLNPGVLFADNLNAAASVS
jgi:FAD/FMN-containing dehydrogenase